MARRTTAKGKTRSKSASRGRTKRQPTRRTSAPRGRAASRRSNGRAASSARAGGRDNAITLLRSDHEAVLELFEEFEKGKDRMPGERKQELAQKICKELTVHTTIEEEIFYPAVREQVEDMAELLDEAKVEHTSAKDLIAQLEEARPEDELYDAKVTVLGEYIKHHVKEEHNEIFPKVRSADMDLVALGERLKQRKSELAQAAAE
jgi:hemerythrin superfamily protein